MDLRNLPSPLKVGPAGVAGKMEKVCPSGRASVQRTFTSQAGGRPEKCAQRTEVRRRESVPREAPAASRTPGTVCRFRSRARRVAGRWRRRDRRVHRCDGGPAATRCRYLLNAGRINILSPGVGIHTHPIYRTSIHPRQRTRFARPFPRSQVLRLLRIGLAL